MKQLLLGVYALGVLGGSAWANHPNVILIVTDDQGYGDMACHGNPWLRTPNLDRLHAESVCLENYHVDPVCTPTRAALMTGRYCTRVGAWAVTEGRQLLDPRETTMAQVFAASGYRTGMFGKWHLGDTYPYAPQYRGFQDVVCHRAGGVDEIGNPAGNDFFDDTYYRNGKPEKFTGYCTDVWFNEALRFIQASRNNGQRTANHQPAPTPFFVYLPLNAMHSPFTVAEKYSRPFMAMGHPEQRARFYGMIVNFDENLGRLLTAVREWGLERDTIVIFMGDNGTAAGTGAGRKADDGFNAGMRGKKGSVYEGGHRVGCFVRWPARFKGGAKVNALTNHRDWLPTLIELCGLQAPDGVKFDGQSIVPLLDGKTDNWPQRSMFIERQADKIRPGTLQSTERNGVPFAVLTERWRLVGGELYDITTDPGQARDVAVQQRDVVKELFAAYQAHYADVMSHGGELVRFQIGGPEENPTAFTVRDWHPTEGQVIWQPEQLSDDRLFINGYWAIEVMRAGRYAIRLSRHPRDAEKPMGAIAARLRLGNVEQRQDLDPANSSVTFEMDLQPGALQLQTWIKDAANGNERGAYLVQAEFLTKSNPE